ncbi:hypothetical protein C5S31_06565 [ANME-1 cluster archaeon GoMg2]|nr:hypothetical protein [ANME-1 cluster archaeon GoMg2]
MKIRTDKSILRFSGIAVLLIITGILMMCFLSNPAYFGIGFALIIMGIVAIVSAIIGAATPKEDMIQDERSVRINEKAGYHAFCILLATMALLQAIGMVWGLNFNFKVIIPDLFIVGVGSWVILRWHYNQRGDIT